MTARVCKRISTETLPSLELGPVTYAVLFHLHETLSIPVARLGSHAFAPGTYVYIGSAKKAAGHRIHRHLRRTKPLHWHVDYVTSDGHFHFRAVLLWPAARVTECSLVWRLASLPEFYAPIKGFGASDCKSGCQAHLLYTAQFGDADQLCSRLPPPLAICQLTPTSQPQQ